MRRLPALLAPLLLLPLLALPLTAGPAGAQTASPTASPSAAPTRDVGLADDGTTVTVRPGEQVRVRLAAPSADGAWQGTEGLETGTPTLHLVQLYAGQSAELTAVLQALSPGRFGGSSTIRPQRLAAQEVFPCSAATPACASAGRTWSVDVVVADGPAVTAPLDCRLLLRPQASPFPGGTFLDADDDGTTVRAQRGGYVHVTLDSCAEPYAAAPRATPPLFRESVQVDRTTGFVTARFRPQASGTSQLSASYDARCLHRTDGAGDGECAVAQRAYAVTVQVDDGTTAQTPCSERLTLTGPARAVAGSTAVLSGRATPGATVRVLFRRYGESAFAVRRTLTAGPDGILSTSWTVADDHRWYAEDGTCTTAPGLTKAAPRIVGPAVVRRGETVTLQVQAVRGVRTTVFFRGAGEPFSARRTLSGPGTVTYTATRDQRYYALTRDTISNHGLTQVR